MIMRIYISSCAVSWKTCFNIVAGVILTEISGLLFFLSNCVMWGHVNIVGHGTSNNILQNSTDHILQRPD